MEDHFKGQKNYMCEQKTDKYAHFAYSPMFSKQFNIRRFLSP